ncbi:MAG: winged helix-turn-helix transcriptional regulator [Methanobacteriota archaeon]
MRLWRVWPALALVAVAALAAAAGASPVSVEVAQDPADSCPASPFPCLVGLDTAGTVSPGDDRITAAPRLHHATVRADPPVGGLSGGLRVEIGDARVRHLVFESLERAWLQADGLVPTAVGDDVELRAGKQTRGKEGAPAKEGVFVRARAMDSAPTPFTGYEPGFCWDVCQLYQDYLYTSDKGSIRLLPKNAFVPSERSDAWTHRAVDGVLPLCKDPSNPVPPACAVFEKGRTGAHGAVSLSQEALPEVVWGFALKEARLRLAEAGPDRGTPPPVAMPGPPPPLLDRDPISSAAYVSSMAVEAAIGNADGGPGSAATAATLPAFASTSGLPVLGSSGSARSLAVLVGLAALVIFAVLYHRVLGHEVLEQETRRKVYQQISDSPGTRVGSVARSLGLNYKTVLRHVDVLRRAGVVEAVGEGQSRLFVTGSVERSEKQAVIALSAPMVRAVLDGLSTMGSCDMKTLRVGLSMPASSVSVAVARLASAGLVVKERRGRRVVLALAARESEPLSTDRAS